MALAVTAALSLASLTSCGGGDSTPRIEAANIPYLATQMPLTPVDIRSRAAYDDGHLAHAVFMENGVVPPELDETPKTHPVVVCGKGAEGEAEERAAAALVKAGFKNVSILKGGMKAYLAFNFPTQSTADEELGREFIEEYGNSQRSADDLTRDAERLKEQIKIEKPEF
jgi:rhodanese-related sulfurtransferase